MIILEFNWKRAAGKGFVMKIWRLFYLVSLVSSSVNINNVSPR